MPPPEGARFLITLALTILLGASFFYWWHLMGRREEAGQVASLLTLLAGILLTLAVALRWIAGERPPLTSQYESTIVFALGITIAYVVTEVRWGRRGLGALVLPWSVLLLLYASSLSDAMQPLPPTLQTPVLLALHTVAATTAYGIFAVAFGAGMLQLTVLAPWPHETSAWEAMGYALVKGGFVALTFMLVIGAYWADQAWGRYWGWDPKEVLSLVVWLNYAGYLHARQLSAWGEKRRAWFLVMGFGAILFTFFSSRFLGGLHSYAG